MKQNTTSCLNFWDEASKETIIWRLQVQSWLQASNNTGILNTCTQLWLMKSEQATPVDSIKDVVQSSVKVPRVRQTPEESQSTYRPKRWGNNNKDEDNSPKTLNYKNATNNNKILRLFSFFHLKIILGIKYHHIDLKMIKKKRNVSRVIYKYILWKYCLFFHIQIGRTIWCYYRVT